MCAVMIIASSWNRDDNANPSVLFISFVFDPVYFISPMLRWIQIHSPLPYEYDAFNLRSFTLQFIYEKAELLALQKGPPTGSLNTAPVPTCLVFSRDQNIYGHVSLNSRTQASFNFELKSCRNPSLPQT